MKNFPPFPYQLQKIRWAARIFSLTNIDAKKAQEVSIAAKGFNFKTITGRILTSGKLQDFNSFDQPEKIKPAVFNGAALKGDQLVVKLPPFSVVVLELK